MKRPLRPSSEHRLPRTPCRLAEVRLSKLLSGICAAVEPKDGTDDPPRSGLEALSRRGRHGDRLVETSLNIDRGNLRRNWPLWRRQSTPHPAHQPARTPSSAASSLMASI